MPCYKKIKNKWSVVFDLPASDGKRLQKRLGGFKSRPEAELAYIHFRANYAPQVMEEVTVDSFLSVYRQFLDYKKPRIKTSSYMSFEGALRHYVYFYEMDYKKISPLSIVKWQNEINTKGLSDVYKSKLHNHLSSFFIYCVKFLDLPLNPCNKAGGFKVKNLKKEMRIWSEEEFKRFIEKADDKLYNLFFRFLYLTGLRLGEARALTWSDLKDNSININKSLTNKTDSGKWEVSTPKNISSIRIVMLPQNLINQLLELQKEYQSTDNNFTKEYFIFGGKYPLSASHITRMKDKYCILGKVKRIRIHDFRHSHVSYLISKGFDIVTIANRLGHSDVEMTLNVYAHIMPSKQKELLTVLNEF